MRRCFLFVGINILCTLGFGLPAQAYVGPGAALGALGVLAAGVAVVALAVLGIFALPLRAYLRSRKQKKRAAEKPEG